MILDDFKELGLSENEAKVYVALLELGQTTTGQIIKKTGIYRVMVYDTLEKLLNLGLANYSIIKNIKYFEAENPKQLLELVKNKEIIAESIITNLSKLQKNTELKSGAIIYEGWKGIKAAQENYFKEFKKSNDEYLMVGASRNLHEKLDTYFNYFHERRSKLGVPAKLLFNENNRKFGLLKKKYGPVQIRFMPKNLITPSWISTYKDMILIGVAEENLPMAFFIKNKIVAESYKQYFYFMWAQSKK
jgi:sugar-specific transcriptional regulator TrmB